MTELLNAKDALVYGRRKLLEADIETAGLDASLLLMKAAGLSRTELATKQEQVLTANQREVFARMLAQRAEHRPIQYILGSCEFMGLEFIVDERVLIPRPDTEILAETVLGYINGDRQILDIGTGSGALAVSAAKFAPSASVTAVDISQDALNIALTNAENHNVAGRVKFLRSDLYSDLRGCDKFDIIMSNPPYIAVGEKLPPSVMAYEPHTALFGGADGLYFYRKIIKDAGGFLLPQGMIFLEIGATQREAVSRLLEGEGFTGIQCIRDLAGRDRVLAGVATFLTACI